MSFFPTSLDFSVYTKYYTLSYKQHYYIYTLYNYILVTIKII